MDAVRDCFRYDSPEVLRYDNGRVGCEDPGEAEFMIQNRVFAFEVIVDEWV